MVSNQPFSESNESQVSQNKPASQYNPDISSGTLLAEAPKTGAASEQPGGLSTGKTSAEADAVQGLFPQPMNEKFSLTDQEGSNVIAGMSDGGAAAASLDQLLKSIPASGTGSSAGCGGIASTSGGDATNGPSTTSAGCGQGEQGWGGQHQWGNQQWGGQQQWGEQQWSSNGSGNNFQPWQGQENGQGGGCGQSQNQVLNGDIAWAGQDVKDLGQDAQAFAQASMSGGNTAVQSLMLQQDLQNVGTDFQQIDQQLNLAGLDPTGQLGTQLQQAYRNLQQSVDTLVAGGGTSNNPMMSSGCGTLNQNIGNSDVTTGSGCGTISQNIGNSNVTGSGCGTISQNIGNSNVAAGSGCATIGQNIGNNNLTTGSGCGAISQNIGNNNLTTGSGCGAISNSSAASNGADVYNNGPAYYVSPDGTGSGLTPNSPTSIANAQQLMENSDIKTVDLEAGNYNLGQTITLGSADSGETWQYYQPDGVDSAVLNGGNSTSVGIHIDGASNVTVNGLGVQAFQSYGIEDDNGSPNATIVNNDVSNMTTAPPVEMAGSVAGILISSPNATVENNYVHDVASAGIMAIPYYAGQSVSDSVISNNVVIGADQMSSDDGAIYVDMDGSRDSGGPVLISNNYVAGTGAAGEWGLRDIYLDDYSSNVTVEGNVLGAINPGAQAGDQDGGLQDVFVHNGNNDTIEDNILNIGSTGNDAPVTFGYGCGSNTPMSNDVAQNNIVLSSAPPGTADNAINNVAWSETTNVNPSWYSVQNNIYWNTDGGPVFTNGSPDGDTSPVTGVNPDITDGYEVGNANLNFPQIQGGWGPPGFNLSQAESTGCGA